MSDEVREDPDATGPMVGEIIAEDQADDLPEDPEEAIVHLLAQLRVAREEASSYLDDLKRVAADFENFRKRVGRERDEIVTRSTQGLIADLLPVLDSFDGAIGTGPADTDERLLAGIRSTHRLLADVLAREGLEPIPAIGLAFDPAVHEAVSGGGTGHLIVTAEMRRGYTLRGRVLRPSLVAVAADDPGGGDPE